MFLQNPSAAQQPIAVLYHARPTPEARHTDEAAPPRGGARTTKAPSTRVIRAGGASLRPRRVPTRGSPE
jgi:hypothetical protein